MKKILCIIMALISMVVVIAQTPDYQGIIYVTPTGAGTNSGDSWANSISSIADAQTLAQTHNAVVWVAAGTYYGDTSATAIKAFSMVGGVNVYGGFIGVEPGNYDLSLRDIETNATILDGQNARIVLNGGGAIWDGFVIQNGKTSSPVKMGGGVYLTGNGVLNNCIIRNNISLWCTDNSAGGVYLRQSTLSNCKILNNRSHDGGGVYASNATVINCEIYDNQGSYKGGGICADGSQVIGCQIHDNIASFDGGGMAARNNSYVSKCDIYNNTCSQMGGGVYADNNSIIDMCNIFENTNNQIGHSGGGVYAANATIKNSHIHHNVARASGGGISATNNAIVSGCIISYNTSHYLGGGAVIGGNSIFVNCLISNNTLLWDYDYSGRAGGVFIGLGGGGGSLHNSTIVCNAAQNVAQGYGAGISAGTSSYNVTNCVIWGNECDGILDNFGTTVSNYPPTCSYSAIEGIYEGEYNVDISGQQIFVNPSLTAGANDSTEYVDWHLLPNAVCINQGNNSFVSDSTDLDGFPRIACDVVDMGCYEFYRVNHVYQTAPASYTWHGNTYTESGDYSWLGLLTTHCDSIEILHLTIGPVGIDDFNTVKKETMTVYPNPTTGIVNVQCAMNNEQRETVEFHVFDAYGKLVGIVETGHAPSLQTDTNGNSTQTVQIDLSRYAPGVYFVKAVADGNVVAVRKVVKR